MKSTSTITIPETPLKDFLKNFDPQTLIEVKEFGDTWHPSSGYVDEKILGNPKTVQNLLDFDYDYRGLIIFDAKIGNLDIYYRDNNYKITGEKKEIEKLLCTTSISSNVPTIRSTPASPSI